MNIVRIHALLSAGQFLLRWKLWSASTTLSLSSARIFCVARTL